MIRSPLASRRTLTHLARLRARPDEDGARAAVYCAMLLALVVTTLLADTSHANRVRNVALKALADGAVTLHLEAERPPAFQVFRIPGENTFAVELPGSSLSGTQLERPEDHPVLAQVRLDDVSHGTSRVVLRFLADVDYDASAHGRELEVQFRALSDVTALRAAYQARQGVSASAGVDSRGLDFAQKEAELHARGLALEQKENRLAHELLDLDKQRRDFQGERDAVSRLQTEAAALRSQMERERREIETAKNKLEQEQRSLQTQINDFTQAKRAQEAATTRELKERQEQRATQEREMRSAQHTLDGIRNEQQQVASHMEGLKKQSRALEDEISRQRTEARDLAEARVHAQKSADEATLLFRREQKEAEENRQKMRDEIAALDERLQGLRAKTKTENAQLVRIQSEQKSAAESLERLKTLVEQQKRASDKMATTRAMEASSATVEATLMQKSQDEAREKELRTLHQEKTELAQRLEQEQQAHQAQLARLESQWQQDRDRFQREREAWGARELQLQSQVIAARETRAAREPTPGFGGPQNSVRPAATPMVNGRLFEFGQGARPGGALHHLSVQRLDLFSSRVGLQIQGKVRYSVQRKNEREVVLTLYDAYAANLAVRRILDTRDLGTNVLRILPRIVESDENRIELTLELRQAASVSASVEGSTLWLQIGQPAN